MPEAAKSLNPQDFVVSANQKKMTGFAPSGTFITITPGTDATNVEQGLDGSVVFSDLPQGWFTVKVAVLQTSDFNDVLDDCVENRKFFPLEIRDLNGRLECTTPTAKVKKRVELKVADKAGANEWEIICVGRYRARGSKVIGA